MPEWTVIGETDGPPATVRSLVGDLRRLGIEAGDTLLVHSSLRSLGWVVGGAQAVVLALEEALGSQGTLVMPTHSYGFTDPAGWGHPAVPEPWWDLVRAELPPYDPDLTPTTRMGAIPECFRKQKGTVRSGHPTISVAARGPHADAITADYPVQVGHGEGSPLSTLYDLDARVLLLGVGHGSNTSLHLAEHRAQYTPKKLNRRGVLAMVDGQRQWVYYDYQDGDSTDFERLGDDFARETGWVVTGFVGKAAVRLFRQREIVDYAVSWMERHRGAR